MQKQRTKLQIQCQNSVKSSRELWGTVKASSSLPSGSKERKNTESLGGCVYLFGQNGRRGPRTLMVPRHPCGIKVLFNWRSINDIVVFFRDSITINAVLQLRLGGQ